ncbi:DUF4244 domain-containing protein [Cellulomonas shaoxiangyii]|uniref:DUF4244 domain-containing protein n=2 Tax=Cellulomonas shaoxiangyii TaxID=2566013 RepID=A0A4P7SMZ0_9CELL|nr:DUF4244 domain-containing protein [Cellulomonas shaoxiangyii]
MQSTGATGADEGPATPGPTAADDAAPGGAGAGPGTGATPASHGVDPAGGVRRLRRVAGDAGMATAEYAIATLAAVGFAGLLVVILKGNEVKGLLTGIIRQALGG